MISSNTTEGNNSRGSFPCMNNKNSELKRVFARETRFAEAGIGDGIDASARPASGDISAGPDGPLPMSHFVRWHLRTKFAVIEEIFSKYLPPGARFIDIACGDGDVLELAKRWDPTLELWGVDISKEAIEASKKRLPNVRYIIGDMRNLKFLPDQYFDVVHEFGGTFLLRNTMDLYAVAKGYLRTAKLGGLIFWELPERWSMAHLMYELNSAPRLNHSDTKLRRLLRSFLPGKYSFFTRRQITAALENTGYNYEILYARPIWHFYVNKYFAVPFDKLAANRGDALFYTLNKYASYFWPRLSGYYLVIRKLPN